MIRKTCRNGIRLDRIPGHISVGVVMAGTQCSESCSYKSPSVHLISESVLIDLEVFHGIDNFYVKEKKNTPNSRTIETLAPHKIECE